MKFLITISFFLSFCGSVFAINTRITYYVTPVDEGGTCNVGGDSVVEPCLPLASYAPGMFTEPYHGNITMFFLHGEHRITSQYQLSLKDIFTFTMSSYNESGSARIVCAGAGELNMEFIRLKAWIKIHSLSFSSCAKRYAMLTLDTYSLYYFELANCAFSNYTNNILNFWISDGSKINITTSNFTNNILSSHLITLTGRTYNPGGNFALSDCILEGNNVDNFLMEMDRIGDLRITDCIFTNNKVDQIVHMSSSTSLVAIHCLYKNNVAVDGSSILTIKRCNKVGLNHCTFLNNTGGTAKVIHITEYVSVSDSLFDSNAAHDNAMILFMDEVRNVDLVNCTFTTNKVDQTVMHLSDSDSMGITNCLFGNTSGVQTLSLKRCNKFELNDSKFFNSGRAVGMEHGSAYINGCIFDSSSDKSDILSMDHVDTLELSDCNLTNNTAQHTVHVTETASLFLRDCVFENNTASALNITVCLEVVINNCNFVNNNGGAIQMQSILFSVFIKKTHFLQNNAQHGGAMYVYDCVNITISDVHFAKNKALQSGGAIYAESTTIITAIHNSIIGNRAGISGGGITLARGSRLKLSHGSKVYFSGNNVTAKDGRGGAIFVPNTCSVIKDDICPIYVGSYTDFINNTGKYLHFVSNYAAEGSIIYGGQLNNCSILPGGEVNETLSGIEKILDLITSEQVLYPANLSHAITSDAQLCFCDNNLPDCTLREKRMSKYQGGVIRIFVININELHEPVPTTVESHYNDSRVSLERNEGTQWIPAKCQEITFHVYSKSPTMAELLVENSNPCEELNRRLRINLDIKSCPHGLELSGDECIYDRRLFGFLENCDTEQQIGKIKSDGWFQYDKEYLKINKHYCPLGYCTKNKSFFHSQCANGRRGVLCGACADNYSIGLGNWRCLQCTHSQYNSFIWLVPLIATAGAVLVVFLLLLKLTVSSGTINGLVFYANVISVSRLTNLPDCSINSLLSVFIAWVNLDFGIETCFYSGMDTYQKTWLQFAFPLYIWFLVGIIIIVCHYSSRAMKLMGKRCIDILATLFLLSYAKLLKTIITALSFVNIMIAKADNVSDPLVQHKVWTFDGNVDYLKGKHLPLFIVALFFLVFLFLPYTLLLTFGQCLRSLPSKRGLRWVRSTVFISIMDAYHAPYNRRHRYWTGLTLLTRCVLFNVFAVNTYNILATNMFTTVIITFLLLVIRLLVSNTVYQNYFKDKLDLFFLLNLEFLAATVYYLEAVGADKDVTCRVATVSVSFTFATFLGIVLYHFYLQVRETELYKKVISKLTNYRHISEPEGAAELLNASRTTMFIKLRESLLESSLD